jgi:nicotinate-nucleotide adenylyltransferase
LKKKIYNNVGILGGTFDPPHKGHLHISKIALKKFKLKKILWIITEKNPLKKKPFLSINKRLNLSKLITKDCDKIFIKRQSNVVKNKNTFNLLKKIKSKNQKIKLFFLIGADNLVNFHKWNKWDKITIFAKIVVFNRPGFFKKAKNSVAAKKLSKNDWIYVNVKGINISSTLIRKFW